MFQVRAGQKEVGQRPLGYESYDNEVGPNPKETLNQIHENI